MNASTAQEAEHLHMLPRQAPSDTVTRFAVPSFGKSPWTTKLQPISIHVFAKASAMTLRSLGTQVTQSEHCERRLQPSFRIRFCRISAATATRDPNDSVVTFALPVIHDATKALSTRKSNDLSHLFQSMSSASHWGTAIEHSGILHDFSFLSLLRLRCHILQARSTKALVTLGSADWF